LSSSLFLPSDDLKNLLCCREQKGRSRKVSLGRPVHSAEFEASAERRAESFVVLERRLGIFLRCQDELEEKVCPGARQIQRLGAGKMVLAKVDSAVDSVDEDPTKKERGKGTLLGCGVRTFGTE